MRRSRLDLIVLFCFVAILSVVAWPAQAQGSADHVLSAGVVNVSRMIGAMQEMKRFQADARARYTDLQQQQQQRESELADMQKHRDNNLKPGSQQWLDETAAMDRKRAELGVWKQVSGMQMERWQKQSVKDMYDHIVAATAQVAEAQHLDLVIADQSADIGPDMDKTTAEQLDLALRSRAVLFSNKKADITEDVLTVVEANFAKQGSQSSAPPTGPVPLPK